MKLCVVCYLLLLACMYPSLAQGSYENCCLKYSKEPKSHVKKAAVDFRIQETDGACNIPAVVFTFALKKSLMVCANPKQRWVTKLMDKIKMRQIAN